MKNVIAMDGPAASGKTTIGRMLAERLGYLFLDTGFMYRAVTLAALQRGVDVVDETAVTHLSTTIEIGARPPAAEEQDGRFYTALLDNQDITWAIRAPEVDANVSQVASYPGVRAEMVRQQRTFAAKGHCVMVGRDIGTVVLPNAPLKLYITASAEERARRRWHDRHQQGHAASYEAILADVVRRDKIDSSREHSPLRPADDAIIIDTTGRLPQEILEEILNMR
ncbi:MAG: (d)CMP kinase [Ardenticatenaceae bacterium]|nr:(d)CMP kinase [Ardenticatenaceae bacterium]